MSGIAVHLRPSDSKALFEESAVMIKVFKPSRSKYFYAWYKKNGKQDQFSCKTTNEREAYKYAVKEVERRLSAVNEPKYSSQLLSEFANEYIEFVKQARYKQKAILAIESSFRLFQKRIGDKPLVKIKQEECEKFIYTGQPSDYTARKHYGHLRAAFRKAVVWERIPKNPFESFEKPSVPELEPEYFTEQEFRQIYDYIPDNFLYQRRIKNIALLAFETGLRLAELRNLKRSAIDFSTGLLSVVNSETFETKSGKNRAVPISQNAKIAINNQMRENLNHRLQTVRESIYLFPTEEGRPVSESEITGKFRPFCRAVFPNREKLSFHKLRHGYATRLVLAGVPVPEIKTAMGHSTIQMTERYAHLNRMAYSHLTKALNNASSIVQPLNTPFKTTEVPSSEVMPSISDEGIPPSNLTPLPS